MKKAVYQIGMDLYLSTIITGINRQAFKQIKERKKFLSKKVDSNTYKVDYIVTIGEEAIIITKPGSTEDEARIPHIVKRWKYIGEEKDEKFDRCTQQYVDSEGCLWFYTVDRKGELITYVPNKKEFIHLELEVE